jgi:ribonuclease HII
VADKLGGRNSYYHLLQQEFDESIVWVGHESLESSCYTMSVAGRRLDVTYQPRAESEHLLVAAASMISKYVRELWMKPFNAFWTSRLPGLAPTAGYPSDARRFWKEIAPLTAELGLAAEHLWRER